MRKILFAAALLSAGLVSAVPAGTSYTGRELDVPIQLRSGVVVTLRTASLVGENFGRRLVLRAQFDVPRPPSGEPRQIRMEEQEAKELCQRHLRTLVRYLSERPQRTITHLEVLYRGERKKHGILTEDLRGMRVDTRRHGCQGV